MADCPSLCQSASLRFGENGIWTIQTQGTLGAELVSSPQATLAGRKAFEGKSHALRMRFSAAKYSFCSNNS